MPPPGASDSASHAPSGDQITRPIGSSPFVTCTGAPPSTAVTPTCGTPVRSLTYASRLPSGEKVGDDARLIFAMRVTMSTSCVFVVCANAVGGIARRTNTRRTAIDFMRTIVHPQLDSRQPAVTEHRIRTIIPPFALDIPAGEPRDAIHTFLDGCVRSARGRHCRSSGSATGEDAVARRGAGAVRRIRRRLLSV